MSETHDEISKEQSSIESGYDITTTAASSVLEDITFPCEWANQVLSECLAKYARDWRECQSQVQLLKKCMTNHPSSSAIEKMSGHK